MVVYGSLRLSRLSRARRVSFTDWFTGCGVIIPHISRRSVITKHLLYVDLAGRRCYTAFADAAISSSSLDCRSRKSFLAVSIFAVGNSEVMA